MAPIDSPGCMGKFYTFKKLRNCRRENIRYWRPKAGAVGHMAVCLTEPDADKVVTVVTATSKDYACNWEFVPIYLTSLRRPDGGQYRSRLELEDYPSACSFSPISSPYQSYLRLEPFKISFEMLKPVHPNERIVLDTYYQGDSGKPWDLGGEEWFLPNMKNGAEHLSLAPQSLHFVKQRMFALFGQDFRKRWISPGSGEVDKSAGDAKKRLAERMGWFDWALESKFERLGEAWEVRKRREAMLARMGIEEEVEDEDEEMEEPVEHTPSLTMAPEEIDAFLESMI